jgi:hypothetical protein
MSTLRVNTIQNSGGTGSPAINGLAAAWVNFNGTGTVAIRASSNVSSITDNGTGDYTVNFTTALADANYCVNATTSIAFGGISSGGVISELLSTGSSYSNKTSSSVRMITLDNNADTAYDSFSTNVAIFR